MTIYLAMENPRLPQVIGVHLSELDAAARCAEQWKIRGMWPDALIHFWVEAWEDGGEVLTSEATLRELRPLLESKKTSPS